jgi:DHA2 family multidrug resistance protein
LRNIGSSIGISVVTTYLAQRTQINHAAFADYITPFNLSLQIAQEQGSYNTTTTAGLSALNQVVNGQAATLAYLQDFRLMMWVTVAALPLVFLLKGPQKKPS